MTSRSAAQPSATPAADRIAAAHTTARTAAAKDQRLPAVWKRYGA